MLWRTSRRRAKGHQSHVPDDEEKEESLTIKPIVQKPDFAQRIPKVESPMKWEPNVPESKPRFEVPIQEFPRSGPLNPPRQPIIQNQSLQRFPSEPTSIYSQPMFNQSPVNTRQSQPDSTFYDRFGQNPQLPDQSLSGLAPPQPPDYIKPAFPTADDFPVLPGQQPELTKEIHLEPKQQKKRLFGII